MVGEPNGDAYLTIAEPTNEPRSACSAMMDNGLEQTEPARALDQLAMQRVHERTPNELLSSGLEEGLGVAAIEIRDIRFHPT